MSTLVPANADDLAQFAIDANPTGRVSPVDNWIGSRVRIKRTSRGIYEQEFSAAIGH